ncbi:MAG: hypothetical protein IJU40_04955 [Desulfovibrionaceae bacterium]|nr:hypothetical protein [Desulfovibrionaceae bacterium]
MWKEAKIKDLEAGLRLDAWLKKEGPDLGLRACRRMVLSGQVLVNGAEVRPAYKLKPGDVITFSLKENSLVSSSPKLLAIKAGYYFFSKPRRLHSVKLAGLNTPSLEDFLPNLVAGDPPLLLQRLDFGTSGLICAGENAQKCELFRKAEAKGLVRKKYLALLEGRLEKQIQARLSLNTTSKKVGITSWEAPKLRQTFFKPFLTFNQGDLVPQGLKLEQDLTHWPIDVTLVGCGIYQGVRHQIRVHAQSLGHPLWLDLQYGAASSFNSSKSDFYLHQAALYLPETNLVFGPSWISDLKDFPEIYNWLIRQDF